MYQKALSRVYSKESATHDEMMERITKAEARKLLMILLLCGDDFSSDFWPIFVTKTRFGDWSVAQIMANPCTPLTTFPSPSPFSPFFSPSLLLPQPQWVKNCLFFQIALLQPAPQHSFACLYDRKTTV